MSSRETLSGADVQAGLIRAAQALQKHSDHLTTLDQAMGDGDLGITASKVAKALKTYAAGSEPDDLGKYLMTAGMNVNSAAPSTMGTLLATALMRAGKEAQGHTNLDRQTLVAMFHAADEGIQQRGKAKPGDKTIIDAVHPAAQAFDDAISDGQRLEDAGERALTAAKKGRDAVTPLRSRVGRAGWVGERTEGKVDPGCELFVLLFRALLGKHSE